MSLEVNMGTPSTGAKRGRSPLPGASVGGKRDAFGFTKTTTVREDSRGRVVLGARATKPDAYQVFTNDAGEILLVPVKEVPEAEWWLWQNPQAMAALQAGLEDSGAGRVRPLDLGAWT